MPKYLNPAPKGEWWDVSWNPVTGCLHGPEICSCSVICWARGMVRRFGKTPDEKNFKPAFHPERLEARFDLIPPSRVFVCDMADLFGEWIPVEWINAILRVCAENPQHRFLFLTKNPARYKEFYFPINCWIGASINYEKELLPRLFHLFDIHNYYRNLFISIEPICGVFDRSKYYSLITWPNDLKWVILGGWSGKNISKDSDEYISLLELRDYFFSKKIPFYDKDNTGLGEYCRKEFPEGLIIER